MDRQPLENDVVLCPNGHPVLRFRMIGHLLKCQAANNETVVNTPDVLANYLPKTYNRKENEASRIPKEMGKFNETISCIAWNIRNEIYYNPEEEAKKRDIIRKTPVGLTKSQRKLHRIDENNRVKSVREEKRSQQ